MSWKRLLPLLLVLAALSHCSTCSKISLNFAAAFGWRGYADTDLALADLGDTYTIACRFMLQYPNAYSGPIISDSATGNFYVAKDYDNRSLTVNFNGTSHTFSGTTLPGDAWQHLAVVRKADKFSVYLNGAKICPDNGTCDIEPGANAASGVLRLGRTADGVTLNNHEPQFYGFIDDVAVYKTALGSDDIAALASATRLTGMESNLFAGYTFDDVTASASPLPALLSRPVTFKTVTPGTVIPTTPAHKVLVSAARDNAFDAKLYPLPFQQTVMHLPFPAGEAWQVIQGYDDSTSSHHGPASFCWDFILARKDHDQSKTKGKPIFAAAGGKVVEIFNTQDQCPAPIRPANYVMIEQAPVEIAAYLHFVLGSVEVNTDDVVTTGKKLAKAGASGNVASCTGYHLHFALHTAPESQAGTLVTFPAAFSDYEVSDDEGDTWSHIDRGVPKAGQWVRNPS
jgi:murein DD-endopeptidase MepM/ murein hydrolase activator NlpD